MKVDIKSYESGTGVAQDLLLHGKAINNLKN